MSKSRMMGPFGAEKVSDPDGGDFGRRKCFVAAFFADCTSRHCNVCDGLLGRRRDVADRHS
jgi:hypothetical protein